ICVLTAVAIGFGDRTVQAVSDSLVTFHMMSNEEIAAYVASGEPMGKAGAYGIQGKAAAFISCIHGSYTGIMGLPLFETTELLKSLR
ncbi:MAG: Maf family protein, partial [Sideroxydans sp.]|nr:Maf family protein [Sideroxydans sp.]